MNNKLELQGLLCPIQNVPVLGDTPHVAPVVEQESEADIILVMDASGSITLQGFK